MNTSCENLNSSISDPTETIFLAELFSSELPYENTVIPRRSLPLAVGLIFISPTDRERDRGRARYASTIARYTTGCLINESVREQEGERDVTEVPSSQPLYLYFRQNVAWLYTSPRIRPKIESRSAELVAHRIPPAITEHTDTFSRSSADLALVGRLRLDGTATDVVG